MNGSDLLSTLQLQYQQGYIDVSALQDSSYTTVFDQLGIAYRLSINDPGGSGWTSTGAGNATTLQFNGTLTGNSIVLGLPASSVLQIRFIPVEGNSEAFTLQLALALPASWTFGQSFPLLNNGVYNNIRLLDPATYASSLTIQASSAIAVAPLTFSGYIDQNSSVFTVLTWFISGGVQNPVEGTIEYLFSTGTVDMDLRLGSSAGKYIFGSTGPSFDFNLSLYSGLNIPLNLYESGIKLETDIHFGGVTAPMAAIYLSSSPGLVTFTVPSISVSFEAALTSIDNFFGHAEAISRAIPPAILPANLTLKGLAFQLSIETLGITYAWMGVSALENSPWEIWPGVLTLSNIGLDFTIYNPFSANYNYRFVLYAETILGGTEGGLPLYVSGELPGLILTGALNADSYNLVPLIEQVFGDSKGLPSELDIVELDFLAAIESKYYSFELAVAGQWDIPFGTDNKLSFKKITVAASYSDDDGPAGVLNCFFAVKGNQFNVELDLAAENVRLLGTWSNPDSPIDYEDIAITLGMYGLPNLPDDIDLNLTEAAFELETAGPSVSFELTSASYGSAALIAGKDAQGNWGFVFGLVAGLDLSINLTDIDVVGNFVPEGMDVIAIRNLRFVGATSAIPLYTSIGSLETVLGTQINSGLVLSIDLNIGTLFSETFSVRFGGLDDGTASDTPPPTTTGDAPAASNNNLQLDVNATPAVPAALPGPTSAWINVQRSFGPVHIARIGFRITEDNSLGLLLDAGVNLAGLSIGLSGLEADIPISAPFWPDFSLAGLEIGYVAPGLTLSGALVKAYGVTPTMYTGELILQAGSFGASAFGSYTTTNNEPSLFAFLALNIPIGGPPFCIVTGLSFGFGYNRRLILPTIDTVQTYPLVQAAMGITDPQQTINALNQYIVPADNQYWLAAGIRFTSFEMLNAYALLTASFGTQVELALMGEALLTLPLAVPGEEELILAQADMVLLASINPSLGQIAINAQLTSRSYVLDRNALITGGFAFYFWFGSSTHKGDFIVTLGGYNPYFTIPAYYPRVPLLGLNWQISSLISIKGGLYCALTPSVIMAGGNLSASYASGSVKAWFNANADFLIRFKPFAFDATIAVSVGASYKLNLLFTTKTISVTVGASLKLWGPPFAGTVTVDLTVMSFTIAFGAAKRPAASSIGWIEFRNSFLPPEPGTPPQLQQSNAHTAATKSLVQFNADRGLISTAAKADLGEYGTMLPDGAIAWRINPGKSRISIITTIPSKTTTISPWPGNAGSLQGLNTNFGVGPMSLDPSAVSVNLQVDIFYSRSSHAYTIDLTNQWFVKPLTENVPSGLWKNTTNSMSGDALVKNVLQGIQLTPKPARPDLIAPMPLSVLLNYRLPDPRTWSWSATVQPSSDYFAQGMQAFQSQLSSPAATAARNSVLDVLAAQGLSVYQAEEIQTDDYAANAQNILYAPPRICYLGETSPSVSSNSAE